MSNLNLINIEVQAAWNRIQDSSALSKDWKEGFSVCVNLVQERITALQATDGVELEKLGSDDITEGMVVVFTGGTSDDLTTAQMNWGGNDDPRILLEKNKEYIVERVDVHSWHTKVYLQGVKGKFNSVHFKIV